jgi:hypothetical protein
MQPISKHVDADKWCNNRYMSAFVVIRVALSVVTYCIGAIQMLSYLVLEYIRSTAHSNGELEVCSRICLSCF